MRASIAYPDFFQRALSHEVKASLLLFHSYLCHEERIWETMGVGGQARGAGEEEEEEAEEVEEQRERMGMERVERVEAEELKSRFKSEKLGSWRRRCERMVAGSLD